MNKYFITGTDTDVGKTLVSSILTLSLSGVYWKPIQSGTSDTDQVKQWTGLSSSHFLPSIYHFKAALSPDQAAELEHQTIQLQACHLPQTSRPLIVEGAGGILVPLCEQHYMLDLIKKLNLPVIIVTRGTLGTINHTLLTIEVLRMHGIRIHGVIYSGDLNPNNQKAIEKKGQVKTLFHIPQFETITPSVIQSWTHQNHTLITENFL